jgi:hypothetical protein
VRGNGNNATESRGSVVSKRRAIERENWEKEREEEQREKAKGMKEFLLPGIGVM